MANLEKMSQETLKALLLECYKACFTAQTFVELSDLLSLYVSRILQLNYSHSERLCLTKLDFDNPQQTHRDETETTVCFYCPLQVQRLSRLETRLSGELVSRHDLPCSEELPETLTRFLSELVGVFTYAAETIQLRTEDDQKVVRDPLTGLFNRRHFLLSLEQWVADGRQFDLILFGLDRFKRVNESLGHPAGDRVLELVAAQLSDVVTKGDMLARVGGDEFAILASRGNDREECFEPNSIHARLAEGFEYRDEILRCYASIGVSRFPEHGADHSELLRFADHAMIKAKQLHTGTVWYDGDLPDDAIKLLALETGIEAAIDKDEFTLAAQPIYDLTSGKGRVAELEILLRWSPENIGFVSPEIFVSIAERMGLSSKLDRYVIRKALQETAHLSMPIAVNLTAPTLYEDDFVDFVSFELSKVGRIASHFGIEITERVIAQPSAARQSLESLGNLGVHIAIDDFGVGYSSLSVLPELPLSRLKIDKKFLIEKDANPRFEEVIIGILRMSSALGLESLIEGVEDPSVQDWLVNVGCDFAQGYGLGRPGAIKDISESHELF